MKNSSTDFFDGAECQPGKHYVLLEDHIRILENLMSDAQRYRFLRSLDSRENKENPLNRHLKVAVCDWGRNLPKKYPHKTNQDDFWCECEVYGKEMDGTIDQAMKGCPDK